MIKTDESNNVLILVEELDNTTRDTKQPCGKIAIIKYNHHITYE